MNRITGRSLEWSNSASKYFLEDCFLENNQIISEGIKLVDTGSDFTGNIKLFTNPQITVGGRAKIKNTIVDQKERSGGYPPFQYNDTYYGQGGLGAVEGKGHCGHAGKQGGL